MVKDMAVQWILLGTASNISKNQISNKKILIKIGRPTIKIIYKSGHHLVYGVRNNVTNLIDFCILKGINEELLKQNHFSCVFIRPHPCALWNIHLRSSPNCFGDLRARYIRSSRSLDSTSYVIVCTYYQTNTYNLLVTTAGVIKEVVRTFPSMHNCTSVFPALEPPIDKLYTSSSRKLRRRRDSFLEITTAIQRTLIHLIWRISHTIVCARGDYTAS